MPRNLIPVFLFAILFQSSISLASNGLPAEDRLKSCEASVALSAAEEIVNNPDILKEPLELFSPAAVLFQRGKKDEAVFWFYAAQLRVRYQLTFEKGDRGQLLSVMLMAVGPPINNYAFQDVSNLNRILDRVLEWDKKAPNPFREKTRSENTEKQIEQVYAGLRDLKAKLSADKSDLEAQARKAAPEIERAYALGNNSVCRKGQLDPAYAKQETQKEWSLVIDFVKTNKDVIREAGGINETYPESSTIQPRDVMASRYIVSIIGSKRVSAVVDVSRSSGSAKFTLACVSHLSLGQRDSIKDVCKQ